jgi:hypothetical protein
MTRNEWIGEYWIVTHEFQTYKNEWIEKENTLDDDDKVLFKTCLLPDRIFHEIIEFLLI